MGLFINILTLFACISAMVYCYILNKRVQAFHNIQDGIGAVIEEMIRSTSELQSAFNQTRYEIEIQSNQLQDKIDEGVALSEYISTLLEEVQNETYRFQQPQVVDTKSSQDSNLFTKELSQDLEDVVPADFDRLKQKKRKPQIMIAGEEYI